MATLSKVETNNGNNVVVLLDGCSAVWRDQITHKFVGTSFMMPNRKIEFIYSGSGHAYFGVCSNGEDINKIKMKCKKEYGKGCIELIDLKIILTIDGNQSENPIPENITEVKPFFDIRFGDLIFNVSGEHFEKPPDGRVKDYQLFLKKSYSPDGMCYIQQPLVTNEDIEIAIESADGAHYWKVEVYLTNDKHGRCLNPPGYLFKKIKNYNGTVRIMKNDDGICLEYKGKSKNASVDKIHLSQEVFVRLHLFRAHITSKICRNDNPCVSYTNTEQSKCVAQISEDDSSKKEMVVDTCTNIKRDYRPSREDLDQIEIKSPRPNDYNSTQQCSPMDEDQTHVKYLSNEDNDEISCRQSQSFHRMLDKVQEMQQQEFSDDYKPMFFSIKGHLEEQLQKLENNVFVSSFHTKIAKQRLEDTFKGLVK